MLNDKKGRLVSAELALAYILAGRATLTLVSVKTGARFTFQVTKTDPTPEYPKQAWFVSLLRGPDNVEDYQYMGLIRSDKSFKLKVGGRISAAAPSYAAFNWAYTKLCQNTLPDQLEIWHDGHCGRCGKKLTVPVSVQRGLGPKCAGGAF